MNIPNAIGFILVGLFMETLHFLSSVTDVREMWLLLMGGVLMSIGFIVLAQTAWLKVSPRVTALSHALARHRANAARGTAPGGRRVSI
jgi:hypothetical protein